VSFGKLAFFSNASDVNFEVTFSGFVWLLGDDGDIFAAESSLLLVGEEVVFLTNVVFDTSLISAVGKSGSDASCDEVDMFLRLASVGCI